MINIFVSKFMEDIIPIIIFGIFYIFDLVLGICKGIFIEGISSNKLKMSIPKFITYTVVIFSSLLFDILIMTGINESGIKNETISRMFSAYSPIGVIMTFLICLIEFVSIIENAEKLNIRLPKFLTKLVKLLNKTIDTNNI